MSLRDGNGFLGPCDLFFTAFEPSGDEHASKVIAEIKRRRPELKICAWGGPKMAKAGALVIERTGDDAVMVEIHRPDLQLGLYKIEAALEISPTFLKSAVVHSAVTQASLQVY